MKIKHFFLIFVIFSFFQIGLGAQEAQEIAVPEAQEITAQEFQEEPPLRDITDTVFSLHILLSATQRNHP